MSKSTLYRFLKKHFGKPYKLRVVSKLKKEHIIKRKEFGEYIKKELHSRRNTICFLLTFHKRNNILYINFISFFSMDRICHK